MPDSASSKSLEVSGIVCTNCDQFLTRLDKKDNSGFFESETSYSKSNLPVDTVILYPPADVPTWLPHVLSYQNCPCLFYPGRLSVDDVELEW